MFAFLRRKKNIEHPNVSWQRRNGSNENAHVGAFGVIKISRLQRSTQFYCWNAGHSCVQLFSLHFTENFWAIICTLVSPSSTVWRQSMKPDLRWSPFDLVATKKWLLELLQKREFKHHFSIFFFNSATNPAAQRVFHLYCLWRTKWDHFFYTW